MNRPPRNFLIVLCSSGLALMLAGCNEQASVAMEQGYGPQPTLPAPKHSWIPTVNIATAIGWPQGAKPIAANGLSVAAFATGLDHPRSLYVLPNGDVLVAETNAPAKPDDNKGIKGWVTKKGDGARGCEYTERQPYYLAAGC
ncbi:glucose/arabinose dehydrogenase [Nitrobacteraceae bacterium AZCC 1564]